MKLIIAAVGVMKPSPEKELVSTYLKRLSWPVEHKELRPGRGKTAQETILTEGQALTKAIAGTHALIALDMRGENLGSEALAERFQQFQNRGSSTIACVIGGAEGLDEGLRKRADFTLAFGKATWPHMLVRAMLAEQLYRVSCILTNHPYHRD